MSTDLIHFRRYAQEVLGDRFPNMEVKIDELSLHERQGNFYYRIYAWIYRKLCIGTGSSQGKAIDDAMVAYADYLGERTNSTDLSGGYRICYTAKAECKP